jgi:hypothetical protein
VSTISAQSQRSGEQQPHQRENKSHLSGPAERRARPPACGGVADIPDDFPCSAYVMGNRAYESCSLVRGGEGKRKAKRKIDLASSGSREGLPPKSR